ncbi:hypothetical protein F5879DRAFT_808804 [Lentinula edodes]|nr:hypothetical protein F5879DRAFT_808804 [Lentinula edodes]
MAGLEIDGSVIRDPSEAQVEEGMHSYCIRSLGIRSIVLNGIFSPADVLGERQEEKVGEWIKSCYPAADVVRPLVSWYNFFFYLSGQPWVH